MCAAVCSWGGWCPAAAEHHRSFILGHSLLISGPWERPWLGALLAGSLFLGKQCMSKYKQKLCQGPLVFLV